ncbi:MAG: biotin/lipoyl-containing protein, partial [Burkholderiales bacterium]
HGNGIYVFERDCSVQRRHQKVLEEAPAPGMTQERREQMGSAAVAAAQAVGYVNAGTVEFIADQSGRFHFMEMNTRLQVEHPVTEMITGEDLVEWQLRVAAGERLPKLQHELTIRGHAVEARIYAEDPSRGFLPATGRIQHLAMPAESASVRVDTGVRAGDSISTFYDPLIAKLIVWGENRDAALAKMRNALAATQIVGLTTNVGFLQKLVESRAFATADLDTGLIERNEAALFPAHQPADDRVLALAAYAEIRRVEKAMSERTATAADRYSPWSATDSWQANRGSLRTLTFLEGEYRHTALLKQDNGTATLTLPSGTHRLRGDAAGADFQVWLDDEVVQGTVVREGERLHVFAAGARCALIVEDPLAHVGAESAIAGNLTAPMPGKIVAVMTTAGATVERGAPLLVLEAMKMEHQISAPAKGVVKEILYKVGEQVTDGVELIVFEPSDE